MDSILSFIGLIRKAGYLETGEENTSAAVKSGKCKAILLAADASDNARRRAEQFAETGKGIPLLELPFTKGELSAATGRAGCSMAALCDIGFASAIAGKLCKLELANIKESAELLSARAEKAARRKKPTKTLIKKVNFAYKQNNPHTKPKENRADGTLRRSKA